jgi:hypothetical protein
VCGGCASCELKSELKKKGKLTSQTDNSSFRKFQGSIENLKYSLESE